MRKRSLTWYRPVDPWLFLVPALLGLFVFRLGPILAAAFMSFTAWDIMQSPVWIGLDNYVELFRDPVFLVSLGNTLRFSAIYVAGVMVLGLLLAVVVNRRLKGISFFRAAFYTPVVTSAVAVAVVWSWILSPRFGFVNVMLERIGIAPPFWIGDRRWALGTVAIVQVWKMSGYYMIIFLAGLQDIPRTFYEAARIDGASRFQTFLRITLPLLSPTTFFVLTISLIDSFQNFEIIYAMTRGGPQNATTTLVYNVFLNAFVFYRMGYASATAYVLLVVAGLFTYMNFLLKKRWVRYKE